MGLRRLWLYVVVIMLFVLGGVMVFGSISASDPQISTETDMPPTPNIQVEGQNVSSKLGTYCWSYKGKGTCADSISPGEIAKQYLAPIVASQGAEVTITYSRPPESMRLQQWSPDNKPVSVSLDSKGTFRLPETPGTYVYDVMGDWPEGDGYHVFTITVRNANETFNEAVRAPFKIRIETDKKVYRKDEKIQLSAIFTYNGNEPKMNIYHSANYMFFNIRNVKTGWTTSEVDAQPLVTTVLQKDMEYRFTYRKSGGYSEKDADADFWRKFFADPDLHLPPGEYIIKAYASFSTDREKLQETHISIPVETTIQVTE